MENPRPLNISLPSPAKINHFLHINGRRPNGYHQLQTVFQFLDYAENLHFEYRNDGAIRLTPDPFLNIPPEKNLIYRAALALQQAGHVSAGVNIHMEKKLPIGAGLGGGSSNAATTLFALNWLWNLHWSSEQLQTLGVTLGADVPVFIGACTAFGEGIGDKLTPIAWEEPWVLVLVPSCQVMTAQMYAHPDLTRNTPTFRIEALTEGKEKNVPLNLRNDFEPVVRQHYPEVDNAIKWLSNFKKACLSGSGASVFACFDSKAEAEQVAKQIPTQFKWFIAKGVNTSPLLQAAETLGFKLENWGVAKR